MQETVKITQTVEEVNKQSTFPTQMVPLPSQGLIYDKESPLSKGLVEIKYMTAKEEDILTTESYIKTNVVLDKLLQSIIVDPAIVRCYDQLLTGDKNALLIAARMYGLGEMYDFDVETPSGNKQNVSVNLTELEHKPLDVTKYNNENKFSFKLPKGGQMLQFKLLTIGDDKQVTEKLKKKKTSNGRDTQLTERLSKMILSVDGNEDLQFINLFVNSMLVMDSQAFRKYVGELQPNINMEIEVVDEETGDPFRTPIAIGSSFFWPEL